MGTIEVLAVSRGLPVDDLLAHAEGGPQAAAAALRAIVPGTTYEPAGTVTWVAPGNQPPESVLISTFGETTMFLYPPSQRRSLVVPPGMGTYSVAYQTVSMAYGVDVSSPQVQRMVSLGPGILAYAEGAPLPFEAAFAAGLEEANATYTFDDVGFAAAASDWMFGCAVLEVPWASHPRPGDRVQLGGQPLHVFTPVATPVSVEPAAAAPRRGGLRRLFGRG